MAGVGAIGGAVGRFAGPILGLALTVLLFASVQASLASSASGACVPNPVTGCPTPPGSESAPPTVSVSPTTDVRTRRAVLHGTINPNGAATTYSWTVANTVTDDEWTTPVRSLAASSSPQAVSTPIERLTPGVTYSVELQASNAHGDTDTLGQKSTFTLKTHPILALRLPRHAIVFEQTLVAHVRVSGAYDPYGMAEVQVDKYPFHRWVNAGGARIGPRGGVTVTVCGSDEFDANCTLLDRNSLIRARIGNRHSRAQFVYVYPEIAFSTVREDDGYSPYLDLTYSAFVHASHRYPRGPVYFYEGASRHGPLTLVAAERLRALPDPPGEQLRAEARIDHPAAGVSYACTRKSLFLSMGEPFIYPACGSRVLR